MISAMNNHVRFFLNNYLVIVQDEVIGIWEKYKQTKNYHNESFGALIGSRDEANKTFWIESCTTPRPQDSATRTGFVMRDSFHQHEVETSFHATNGLWGYIGTWHTHPEPDPIPSSIDINDWLECSVRNPDRFLFFFIVGTAQTRAFMKVDNKFIRMNMGGEL